MHQNNPDPRIISMIKDYNQILPNLEQDIINKIKKLERRSLVIKQSIYSLVSVISLIGTVFSFSYLINIIEVAGAFEYATLIFYDMRVITYWKELSLSVAESVPFLVLAVSLGIMGIFTWSALRAVRIQVFKSALI